MVLSKLRNAVEVLTSPARRTLNAAADLGDDIMVRRKNEAVMKVPGANTDQPQEVLRTLRALQQAMRYQDPTVVTPVIRDSGPFLSTPFTQYARHSDEETWH